MESYRLKQFCRPCIGLVPVNFIFMSPFISEEHIFPNCHIRNQGQLLMDNNDPLFLTVLNGIEFTDLTIVNNIPFIGSIRVYSTQYIHKCGFSSTIFSYKCVDFTFLHLQIYIVKRLYARECLGNIFHFQ